MLRLFENLRKNVEVLHANPGLGWQRGFNKVNLVAQRIIVSNLWETVRFCSAPEAEHVGEIYFHPVEFFNWLY